MQPKTKSTRFIDQCDKKMEKKLNFLTGKSLTSASRILNQQIFSKSSRKTFKNPRKSFNFIFIFIFHFIACRFLLYRTKL